MPLFVTYKESSENKYLEFFGKKNQMACFCFEDYSRILKVFEPYGEIHLLHKICSWTYVLGILVELKENRLYRVLERDSCSNMTKVLNVHIIQFRKKYGPKVKKKLIGTV